MNGLVIAKKFVQLMKKLHLMNIVIHTGAFGLYLFFLHQNNIRIYNLHILPPQNRPRFIIAGNHASGFDAYISLGIMSGRLMRRVYAVAHERSFRSDTFERLMLTTFEMIPREGTGQEVIDKQARYLLEKNRTIIIPPEGMFSKKVMKAYTGVMRLYWRVNRQFPTPCIPIIPVATIGATEAYPFEPGSDGKYHMHRKGIAIRVGEPFMPTLPAHPDHAWFRDQTDLLMSKISKLAMQKGDVIASWKQDQLEHKKPRKYKV